MKVVERIQEHEDYVERVKRKTPNGEVFFGREVLAGKPAGSEDQAVTHYRALVTFTCLLNEKTLAVNTVLLTESVVDNTPEPMKAFTDSMEKAESDLIIKFRKNVPSITFIRGSVLAISAVKGE